METLGRRVLVRDDEGERMCFLSGQRAVVGDHVRWVEAPGEGGKLVAVEPRQGCLRRMDVRGQEQILASWLGGVFVVQSVRAPDFWPGLLHRYLAAAWRDDLDVVLVLNKVDLGIPDAVEEHLALLAPLGLDVVRTSKRTGEGIEALRERVRGSEAPWALVGASGVGKTSLIGALLPGQDVGPVGDISDYWGTGRHTTTSSKLFALPGGGEIADSPGIRGLIPALPDAAAARTSFPLIRDLACRYRDCNHRPGEEGCTADTLPEAIVSSYRALLDEVVSATTRY